MNHKFYNVRKGDRFFKAVWKPRGDVQYINGRDTAEAFNNSGIGLGALPALDYHAEVYPCLKCDFIGDTKGEQRKHRCDSPEVSK